MSKHAKTVPSFVATPARASTKSGVHLEGMSAAKAAAMEGKKLRQANPREAHEMIGRLPPTRDVVELILASNKDRVAELVPVRHTRMLESPFTAGIQAHDLACAPSSGVTVQCCGDSHLMNFGGFATPERRVVFDLNDFDETFPAPFEWDLKRLAASMVLAARWRSFPATTALDIAEATARAYRERMLLSGSEATLDAWYSSVTWKGIRKNVDGIGSVMREVDRVVSKGQSSTAETVFHKLTDASHGPVRILDQPPLLYHPSDIDVVGLAKSFLDAYVTTLREDYRHMFERLRFVDAALKVVGVGSVGTRCFVALMLGEQNEPVFIQIKEARDSVLSAYLGQSPWRHNGERVVVGQRLMQSASDIFLGWARGKNGRDFYVRQLRDMKMSFDVAKMGRPGLTIYGVLCGETLARAHAKAGGAGRIAGYLGKSDAFDKAIRRYAGTYADQAEADFDRFRQAARTGRIPTASDAIAR